MPPPTPKNQQKTAVLCPVKFQWRPDTLTFKNAWQKQKLNTQKIVWLCVCVSVCVSVCVYYVYVCSYVMCVCVKSEIIKNRWALFMSPPDQESVSSLILDVLM